MSATLKDALLRIEKGRQQGLRAGIAQILSMAPKTVIDSEALCKEFELPQIAAMLEQDKLSFTRPEPWFQLVAAQRKQVGVFGEACRALLKVYV